MARRHGQEFALKVTHVEKDGYFIRLTGQTDQQAVSEVTRLFEDAREKLENGVGAVSPASFQPGEICAAKHNGAFFRGKIIDTSAINTGLVHVQLIDCGIKIMIPVTSIRGLQNYSPKFLQQGLAYDFHLAGIWHPSGTWGNHIIKGLRYLLCGSYFRVKIEMVTNILPIISVHLEKFELGTHLGQNQVGAVIDILGQVLMLYRQIEREGASYNVMPLDEIVPFGPSTAIAPPSCSLLMEANQGPLNSANDNQTIPASSTFQNKLLEVNSSHTVSVSFIEEGPQLFQLQLISDSQEQQQMMDALNKMLHCNLTEPLMIGTPCLVRNNENRICRALVQKVSWSQCTVYLVDFGTTEIVSNYCIYSIPKEFLLPKMFAMKFCLSGVRKFMKKTEFFDVFSQIVMDQDLTLEVTEREGPLLVQYGKLYLDGQSVLDLLLLKLSEHLEFKQMEIMRKGSKHRVIVSHVDSLIKFHVQLFKEKDELKSMMKAVSVHCENSNLPGELAVGAACCARLGPDSKWYRAVVKGMASRGKVPVLAVDYGYEQTVAAAELRPILPYLMDLPAQAVHCALIGFEDLPPDEKLTQHMSTYTLEKTFTAKVVRLVSGVRVVNLTNKTGSPRWDIYVLMKQKKRGWLTSEELTPTKRLPPRPFTPSISGSDIGESTDDEIKDIREQITKEKQMVPLWSRNECQRKSGPQARRGHNSYAGPSGSYRNNRPPRPQPSTSTNNRFSKNRAPDVGWFDYFRARCELSDPVEAGTLYPVLTMDTTVNHNVSVCWFNSAANFYVQLDSSQKEFTDMIDGIPAMYRGVSSWNGPVPTGAAVLARYDGDELCYRAKVLGRGPRGYQVHFVDYGNDGTVKADEIWPLSVRLSHLPQQAIHCALKGVREVSNVIDLVEPCFDGPSLTCTFNGREAGANSVSLWRGGVSVADTLVDRGLALADVEPAVPEAAPAPAAASQQLSCRLSHGASLRQLFLQRDADRKRLDTLLADMNYFYQLGPAEPLRSLGPGSRCAAKSADGRWYRGAVLAHTARHAAVRFTDRGHSELVPRDHVKLLLHRFCELPALALEVSLGVDPLRSDAVDKLMEWCEGKELEVTLGDRCSDDVWLASLCLDKVDLAEKLVAEKFATLKIEEQPSPRSRPGLSAYITHIDTPGNFWVQMLNNSELIDKMHSELQANAASYNDITKRAVGVRCVTKHVDHQWYRAEIVGVDKSVTTLRFIDYGNTEELRNENGLKVLPDSLKKVEGFAMKAGLNAKPVYAHWSSQACEQFTQLVGELPALVTLLTRGLQYVDVFRDGRNLTEELISKDLATRADGTQFNDLSSINTATEHNIVEPPSSTNKNHPVGEGNSTASTAACDNLPSTSESVHAIPLSPVVEELVTADDNQIKNNDATQRVAESSTQITDTVGDLIQF